MLTPKRVIGNGPVPRRMIGTSPARFAAAEAASSIAIPIAIAVPNMFRLIMNRIYRLRVCFVMSPDCSRPCPPLPGRVQSRAVVREAELII
jgi:hypothetical protein